MKQQIIKLSKIVENKGQIEGLPRNPRQIKDEKYKLLKKSIEDDPEMLELRELLVYPHNNKFVVIGGNMRLKALRELGVAECPCKVIPAETPVEKLRAYTIKDNNSFGDYDYDLLGNDWEVDELLDWGCDLPDITIEEETKEAVEDDYSEEDAQNAESIVKRGEIWQLGEHRLMCGDSTCGGDVALLMNGEKADMCVTDPPYNVAYEGKTKDKLKIQNDKMQSDNFFYFLKDAFTCLIDNLKEGGAFYVWHAFREQINFENALNEVGLEVRQQLIWAKNSLVLGRQDYQWKHEPCFYGWKEGASHEWYSDRNQTTILEFKRPTRNDIHPTMKPVDLIGYQINNSSKSKDKVLDIFGGSGSTLIACEQLNRKCYMMELDEHYCDVIIDRWQKLTGKTAVKIKQQ